MAFAQQLTRTFHIIFSLFMIPQAFGHTASILSLSDKTLTGDRIGSYVEYIEDSRPAEQFAEISKDWSNLAPKKQNYSAFNLGMNIKPHWFKLIIDQPAMKSMKIYLEHDYPTHLLEVFHRSPDASLQVYRVGYGADGDSSFSYRNQTIPLELEPGQHEVYFRIQHFAAMRFSVRLWSEEAFARAKVKEEMLTGIVLGISLLMVFYNICMYITLRSTVYLHYVGYLCATTGFLVFYSGVGQELGSSVKWFVANFWVSYVGLMLFFVLRFTRVFLSLKQRMPRIDKAIRWLSYLSLFVLVLDRVDSAMAFIFIQALANPSMIVLLGIASISAFKGYRPAGFYLIAFIAVILGALTEGFVTLQILGPDYSFWPFFATYCLQMVLLSLAIGDQIHLNQKAAQKKIEGLNKDLHHHIEHISEIVEDRTKEIRSLLDHIPQGVFSIEEHLKISKQYSAHLPQLLGSDDIAGHTFVELILDRASLSVDEKDRLIQTLNATIGEDEICFEANSDNLPTEIALTDDQGVEKVFGMTWNVEPGNNGLTKSILVTLLDVTQAKSLELEIRKQQSDMRLVKELIDCGSEKFAQFVATAGPLLAENDRLISHAVTDEDTLKIMFVNAHTVKGAARTLGLSALSNSIHQAEHYYSEIIRKIAPVDLLRMQSEMKVMTDCFAQYLSINHDTLGRTSDLKKVQVDKKFLAEHLAIMFKLEEFQRSTHDESLSKDVRSSLDQIVKIIYKGLPFIVEDCFMHASRIAKDLGKRAPELRMNIVAIAVPEHIEDVLRKISVHLIRNAMDHGIESPEERTAVGKKETGVLVVDVVSRNAVLQFVIKDDGRGLAIGALREQGIKAGILKSDSPLAQIAHTIFESGVSTSRAVSHISGRGIGMDAVKRYIEEVGGSIELALKDPLDSSGNYYAFETVITLPLPEVGMAVA